LLGLVLLQEDAKDLSDALASSLVVLGLPVGDDLLEVSSDVLLVVQDLENLVEDDVDDATERKKQR